MCVVEALERKINVATRNGFECHKGCWCGLVLQEAEADTAFQAHHRKSEKPGSQWCLLRNRYVKKYVNMVVQKDVSYVAHVMADANVHGFQSVLKTRREWKVSSAIVRSAIAAAYGSVMVQTVKQIRFRPGGGQMVVKAIISHWA